MTKPTQEFIAFNRRFGRNRHRWPRDLYGAAQYVRCELRCQRNKGWKDNGGPERLEGYEARFESQSIAWAMERRARTGSVLAVGG